MTIRLLLADDQALVRGALAALLDLEDDLQVVAQVGSGDLVVEAVREHAPDVALLDIEMPGLDGIAAAAAVRAAGLPRHRPTAGCERAVRGHVSWRGDPSGGVLHHAPGRVTVERSRLRPV